MATTNDDSQAHLESSLVMAYEYTYCAWTVSAQLLKRINSPVPHQRKQNKEREGSNYMDISILKLLSTSPILNLTLKRLTANNNL